jgi:Mrp family chromosome partitioning ATPase
MQQRKLVLVTGSRRDEGRSTILLMLARAAASRGLHVVMVDADVRRPQLATLLGVSPACGWEAVAAGEAPLHEALIESPLERLTLLPFGGRAVAIDEGSRSSLSLAGSLATLRENYELVLIDVGPLESDSVAIDLATRLVGCPVDDAIICRDASSPEAESLSRVGRRLAAAGVAHWDVVDNFTKRGS